MVVMENSLFCLQSYVLLPAGSEILLLLFVPGMFFMTAIAAKWCHKLCCDISTMSYL